MLRNIRSLALSAALAAASIIGTTLHADRADAQVYIGGPGYVGAGFGGVGLGVGGFSPYGYGYRSGYGLTTGYYGSGYGGSYYTSTFYGAPTVGYLGGGYGVGYLGGGYGYGYLPYGYYRGPWGRGFALPPLVIPAETIYGPLAVQNFLGVGQSVATPVTYNSPIVNGGAIAGGGFGVNAPGVRVPKAQVPASNQAARDRAKRHLDIGDDWFRKQQYGNAAQAYRDAIKSAPDVADAYFHQAAVSIAQQLYEPAVEGIKSGLKISTTYVDGGFKYSTLYGPNRIAKEAHLEMLALAATDAPSSDLYYLMGVLLFFDEQPRRSGPFFTKARELAVGETWHIDVFLEILKRMDAAAAEEAVKKAGAAAGAQPAAVGAPPAANPPKLPAQGADGKEI